MISQFKSLFVRFFHRVPLVLQFEVVECGAASLSMILKRYGYYAPLSELRKACGVSRDGSNMLNIKNAAQSYGLDVKAYRPTVKHLVDQKLSFPLICWWNLNHFVVLDKVVNSQFFISDPAGGRYVLSQEDFEKSYSGLTLSFSPSSSFRKKGKDENPLKLFIPYLLKYRAAIVFLILITLAALVPSVVSPGLSGAFVNDFLQNKRYNIGIPIIWLSIFIAFLSLGLSLVELKVVRRMALLIQRKLTLAIAVKLFTVDFSFFASRYLGDISSRLGLGADISSILVHQLLPLILSLVGALLILPFILIISWQLSLFSLVYVVITMVVSLLSVNLVIDSNRSIQVESGKLSGLNVRMFSDIKTIKSSGLQNSYLERYQELYAPILIKQQSIQFTSSIFSWISTLIQSVYSYGSIALSGFLVMNGDMNLAGFMAFQALRSQVTTPLLGISSFLTTYQSAVAELSRLLDLTNNPDDTRVFSLSKLSYASQDNQSRQLSANENKLVNVEAQIQQPNFEFLGDISIKDMSISFSPLLPPTLSDLSFDIKSGEMVTFVGSSGSGKSTLLKIISGLYTHTAGSVTYNGESWSQENSFILRPKIGYVAQDAVAFNGTIKDNITLCNPDVDADDVLQALEIACLSDFVAESKDNLHTIIKDNGSSLSGGQLQRLELARAIVKKPKVICLDEATSSLDIPTEKRVLDNLKRQGFTIVCVAHRLVSALMSDQVIVLDHGKVIEIGEPKALLEDQNSILSKLHSSEVS